MLHWTLTRYAAAALAVGLLSLAPALAEDKVLAKINGNPITESDLAIADEEIGQDLGSLPPEQKRLALIEYLVDNQLFAEAAEEQKFADGPEFKQRLTYLKRKALREIFFEKGIRGTVPEAEVRKVYDEQVGKIVPEEEVHARHILVDTEEKAKELADQIAKGGDFAAIAKENTKDAGSKEDGGNLGYFSKGQMVPQFEEAAFKLQKGEVSPPIQTQFGWHLIKLEDRREKKPPSFEVVKDRILNSMLLRKAQEISINLRSKAKIEYVDAEVQKVVEERKKLIESQPGSAEPAKGEQPKE